MKLAIAFAYLVVYAASPSDPVSRGGQELSPDPRPSGAQSFDPRAPWPSRRIHGAGQVEQRIAEGMEWAHGELLAAPQAIEGLDTRTLGCLVLAVAVSEDCVPRETLSAVRSRVMGELYGRFHARTGVVLEADCTRTDSSTELLVTYACAELFGVRQSPFVKRLRDAGVRALESTWSSPARVAALDSRELLVAVALQERVTQGRAALQLKGDVEALPVAVATRLESAPDDPFLIAAAILCELGLARPIDPRGTPLSTRMLSRATLGRLATVWQSGEPLDWIAASLVGRALLWSAAPEWTGWRGETLALLVEDQASVPPDLGSWGPRSQGAPWHERWARTAAAVVLLRLAGTDVP